MAFDKPIKPFTFGKWHAWQGTGQVMLSDESIKKLRSFPNKDGAINFLYGAGSVEAARALHAHTKES